MYSENALRVVAAETLDKPLGRDLFVRCRRDHCNISDWFVPAGRSSRRNTQPATRFERLTPIDDAGVNFAPRDIVENLSDV